jgi:hypothetical protein
MRLLGEVIPSLTPNLGSNLSAFICVNLWLNSYIISLYHFCLLKPTHSNKRKHLLEILTLFLSCFSLSVRQRYSQGPCHILKIPW